MNEKYNNKYRRGSHRFPGWNYGGDGMYYITLVTQGRECHLGKIENGEMHFSDFGNIVKDQFLQSFEMRTELFLDEYVIMPNHIHAIVVLINRDGTGPNDGGGRGPHESPRRSPKSISSFMAGFKSSVNSKIDDYIDRHHLDIPKFNRRNPFFQKNYHDRVVRDRDEYGRIKNYIRHNVVNWNGGKPFAKNHEC